MSTNREQRQTAARLLSWFADSAHVRGHVGADVGGHVGELVTVAFSGGVDSALVLAAAVRALGADRVVAATAVSPALPSGMLDDAATFARSLGVEHRRVPTREMDVEGYTRNGHDRCYFCKATLVDALGTVLDHGGAPLDTGHVVLTGTNADDVIAGWRPGIRAAAERGALTPLADTAMGKADVRALARFWELPVWDRPASPCLSSRVAYGVTITPARLARVDRAEAAVRALLVRASIDSPDLRVRDLGDAARIEVAATAVDDARRSGAVDVVRAAGFPGGVSVEAFASGRLNAVLPASLQHA